MSRLLRVLWVAVFLCIASHAERSPSEEPLRSYMLARLTIYLDMEQQAAAAHRTPEPIRRDAPVTLTMKEAARFIAVSHVTPPEYVIKALRDETSPDATLLNGWQWIPSSRAYAISATMGASSSASTLFCVLDHDRIYELCNEMGFQPRAACAWYGRKSALSQQTKAKVITLALSYSRRGGLVGFIEQSEDLIHMSLELQRSGEIEPQEARWISDQTTTLELQAGYTYSLTIEPFLAIQRISFKHGRVLLELRCKGCALSWNGTEIDQKE